MFAIFSTFDVIKVDKFKEFKETHPENRLFILIIFDVSKLPKSKYSSEKQS